MSSSGNNKNSWEKINKQEESKNNLSSDGLIPYQVGIQENIKNICIFIVCFKNYKEIFLFIL
jgi:hypothetical protein